MQKIYVGRIAAPPFFGSRARFSHASRLRALERSMAHAACASALEVTGQCYDVRVGYLYWSCHVTLQSGSTLQSDWVSVGTVLVPQLTRTLVKIIRQHSLCCTEQHTSGPHRSIAYDVLCACLHLLETSLRWHSTEKISRNTKFKICIWNFKFLLFRNCITIATINISQKKKRAFEIAVIWNAALAVYMEDLGLCILIDFCAA